MLDVKGDDVAARADGAGEEGSVVAVACGGVDGEIAGAYGALEQDVEKFGGAGRVHQLGSGRRFRVRSGSGSVPVVSQARSFAAISGA